jgi:short subunit dehydrogenase-like uncharacterized protein
MASDFVLYGSTGYVGRAAARLAVDQGLRPLLVGRNRESVSQQAMELGLEHRIVALDQADTLDAVLNDAPVVLNFAGPYMHTHRPIIEACLRTGTHYLDITGEPPVFDSISSHDGEARDKGVMLLPAVGFDVVPTDCLAAHLKGRLPSATKLTLAFSSDGPAGLPPGTLNTLIELVPYGSSKRHRVNGKVVDIAGPRPMRVFDCGDGPVEASLLTWGDIFLAYRSTGIPNIEVYSAIGLDVVRQMDVTDRIRILFRSKMVRSAAKRTMKGGSTADERARTTSTVWGEVVDSDGNRAVSCLHGPEPGQVWTSRTAVAAVARVLSGDVSPGFQTPSLAFGPDFVLEAEGVTRVDLREGLSD